MENQDGAQQQQQEEEDPFNPNNEQFNAPPMSATGGQQKRHASEEDHADRAPRRGGGGGGGEQQMVMDQPDQPDAPAAAQQQQHQQHPRNNYNNNNNRYNNQRDYQRPQHVAQQYANNNGYGGRGGGRGGGYQDRGRGGGRGDNRYDARYDDRYPPAQQGRGGGGGGGYGGGDRYGQHPAPYRGGGYDRGGGGGYDRQQQQPQYDARYDSRYDSRYPPSDAGRGGGRGGGYDRGRGGGGYRDREPAPLNAGAAPYRYDDRYADAASEPAQPPLPAGGLPPVQREYEDRRAPPPVKPRDDDFDVYVMNTEGNNGLVVGPRGANVKKLEQMSGCKINCNQDKTTVEISGPPRGIQMAIEAINDLIDSRQMDAGAPGGGGGGGPPPHQRDSRDLRHTIAGGGSGMKRGRYDDDYPPLDDHRAGGPNSAGKRQRGNDGGIVHNTLIDKLRDEAARRNIPQYEPIQTDFILQLPPDDRGKVSYEEVVGDNLGLIIGKKFNTHKELQRIMDCSFKVWDEKKAVSYHGFPEKVAEAVLLVQELCYLGQATKKAREEEGDPLPVKQHNHHQQQQQQQQPRQQSNKDETYEPREGEIVETMEAPGKIGLVLGRKGFNITRIRRSSNCNVHADNESQSIRIVGTPENVQKCVQLINETIEKGNKIRAEKQQQQQGEAPAAAATEDEPIADADADAQPQQQEEGEAMVAAAEEQQPAELADADAENAVETAPAAPTAAAETETEQKEEEAIDFSKMTVAQLKAELEKRNLPTDGLKAALVQRLEEAA